MKKLGKAFLMLVSFAVLFTGCEDDISQTEIKLDMSKTGAIEVYLNANLNKQEIGNEPVPDGVKVFLSIDYSDLTTMPGATQGWTKVVETRDGKISVDSIPTIYGGLNLQLEPEDFVYSQRQLSSHPMETMETLFFTGLTNVAVNPGRTSYENILYNSIVLGDPAVTVTRAFEGLAILDEEEGFEPISSIDELFITGTGAMEWERKVTNIDRDGIFTVSVPIGESFRIEFISEKFVWDAGEGDYVNDGPYRYIWNSPGAGYSEDSPVYDRQMFPTTISFGGGTPL